MSVRIPDMPDLGTPTDDSLFVADHVGSGVFTGAALKSYALTGTLGGLTVASLTVNGITDLVGPVGVDSTLTVVGGTHLESDVTIDGHTTFAGNLAIGGSAVLAGQVLAADGFHVTESPPFGLALNGTSQVLAFAADTYIARDGTTGAMLFGLPTVGECLAFQAVTGAVLIKGGPNAQIGTFGTDGYIVVNGSSGFSSGSIGAASLVVNGGGRGPQSFEFFTNGTKLNAFGGDGQAYKPGGGAWADISDARIKQDVADYTAGLEQIMQLRPVTYRFKPETGRPDRLHHGLIAQEAEAAMPEMVTAGPDQIGRIGPFDDMRTLDTTPLLFALVNAVTELAGRVAELEAEVR